MGYFPWLVSGSLIMLNPGEWWGREKIILCSGCEREFVQGQSWTVVVVLN